MAECAHHKPNHLFHNRLEDDWGTKSYDSDYVELLRPGDVLPPNSDVVPTWDRTDPAHPSSTPCPPVPRSLPAGHSKDEDELPVGVYHFRYRRRLKGDSHSAYAADLGYDDCM